MYELVSEPAFRSTISSNGQGECWSHTNDNWKFQQEGWRTKEGNYRMTTLVGNWNEQRFDENYIKKKRSSNSQYSNYFQTTNQKDYSNPTGDNEEMRGKEGRSVLRKVSRAFPGHQPVSEDHKEMYKFTTAKIDFVDPRVRRQPQM